MDLQNPASQWSYHRMAYTENFIIFWEKGFGNDLSNPPRLEGHSMKVNLPNLKEKWKVSTPISTTRYSLPSKVRNVTNTA